MKKQTNKTGWLTNQVTKLSVNWTELGMNSMPPGALNSWHLFFTFYEKYYQHAEQSSQVL